ncbi:MAG: DUF87 domain-containing protein [Mollicutes bacterium]|nr:DUF87 domain-containing protein [Mollicutes bacterium]
MLGKIEKIIDNKLYLKLSVDPSVNKSFLNLYVVIKDENKVYIGEIISIDSFNAIINLLGEYNNNEFEFGIIKKPALKSTVDLIDPSFIGELLTFKNVKKLEIAKLPFYDNVPIKAKLSALFGNHFAIFGSTGSGKSCAFARIMQNLLNINNLSNNIHIALFDTYGEYTEAFSYLNEIPNKGYKIYSSNLSSNKEIIYLPPWLLDIDDYALLLNVTKPIQISILEKTLRNVSLFKRKEEEVIVYKNSIIAQALLDIILSGRQASQIRDLFISALTKFKTKDLNLESIISQPGYNRTVRQCLLIDSNNKINAIEEIVNFLEQFSTEEVYTTIPDGTFSYSLNDFADALDFALISEGVWKSDKIYDDFNILKVRLNSLLNSDSKSFFLKENDENYYIDRETYIKNLFLKSDGSVAQIINFNISELDDRFARVIVKIYSKLFFNYLKSATQRASFPINIILEEAHRYVQSEEHDTDNAILGYNIFERITKEGRKYGNILTLISQRPSELSETCLSQCSNFLFFKMTHPVDINYIAKAIPDVNEEIIEKMKVVKAGHAICFGNAFKCPSLLKFDLPNPLPNSDNVDLDSLWFNS